MPHSDPLLYRPNVAAIVQQPDGCILLGERSDRQGAWQFPQGGIDPGETPRQALERELMEEILLSPEHYTVGEERSGYRYLFPDGMMKRGFHGQEQTYFLVNLSGPPGAVSADTQGAEFQRLCWIQPAAFDLNGVIPMKQAVYRKVFEDFFGIELRFSEKFT